MGTGFQALLVLRKGHGDVVEQLTRFSVIGVGTMARSYALDRVGCRQKDTTRQKSNCSVEL